MRIAHFMFIVYFIAGVTLGVVDWIFHFDYITSISKFLIFYYFGRLVAPFLLSFIFFLFLVIMYCRIKKY